MLTILHKEENGYEGIQEVEFVSYYPSGLDMKSKPCLSTAKGNFSWGSVYVMNSNGKTVATYHFD